MLKSLKPGCITKLLLTVVSVNETRHEVLQSEVMEVEHVSEATTWISRHWLTEIVHDLRRQKRMQVRTNRSKLDHL